MFMTGVREGGPLVVCGMRKVGSQPMASRVLASMEDVVVLPWVPATFGEACDARITGGETAGVGTRFTLRLPDGTVVASRIKQNPGLHNVANGQRNRRP